MFPELNTQYYIPSGMWSTKGGGTRQVSCFCASFFHRVAGIREGREDPAAFGEQSGGPINVIEENVGINRARTGCATAPVTVQLDASYSIEFQF